MFTLFFGSFVYLKGKREIFSTSWLTAHMVVKSQDLNQSHGKGLRHSAKPAPATTLKPTSQPDPCYS